MKKILFVNLTLITMLFLTACDNNDSANTTPVTAVASATDTQEGADSNTVENNQTNSTTEGNNTNQTVSSTSDTNNTNETASSTSDTNNTNETASSTSDTNNTNETASSTSDTNNTNETASSTSDTNNTNETNNSIVTIPSISANAGVAKTVEINKDIVLTGTSTGTVIGYLWFEGTTLLAKTASFTYTGKQIGNHTLTFRVMGLNNSTITDKVTITVTAEADVIKDFGKLIIPKFDYTKDYFESSKSGTWHLDYPSNKYGHKLSYDSNQKAYRIRAVEEALKSDGSRVRDGYTTRVASPDFVLSPDKNYQIVIKMKAESFPAGQNVMITLRGPTGDTSSKWETLWNVSQENTWEEVYIPITPSIINNPKGNKWKLTFFSSVAFGAYSSANSSDILISEDIDIFEVPQGKELVSVKEINLGQEKIPFESSTRKVDILGNFYVKNSNGSWQHIFPKLIYRNTDRSDYSKLFSEYLDYGFTGIMDLSSVSQLNSAIEVGMTNLSLESSPPYVTVKGGKINYDLMKKQLTSLYATLNQKSKQNLVIWHNFDNENSNVGKYDYQEWLLSFVNEYNPDTVTGKHLYPIFYLNGRKGLARSYRNNQRKVMDITGTYIGKDTHGNNKNGKKDLESKMLTQFLTPNQIVPSSVIQIQKHFDKKFIPSIFYGIIQGGRALSVWRDGKRKHGDTTYDFKDSYWANAFKNDVSPKLDKLLPLIKEPQFTSWSASTNVFPEVRIGTRQLNEEGYIILSNFANNDKSVTINLQGISPSSAVDYFTGKEISKISNNKFTFTLKHYNQGYQVIKLVN